MQLSVEMKREDILKVLLLLIVLGLTDCRGNSNPAYRAMRYGSYYKSTYYSYTGGVGYARYGRVYARVRNLYSSYYNYMFQWMNTDAYTVYKNTPSDSISVCKNYEANDNGTYMGVFTCPLPFVPPDYHYCCGEENAEYCCRFWDVPLNIAAVLVGSLMGLGIFVITVYLVIQLCRQKHKTDREKRARKVNRRFGLINRGITMTSMWTPEPGQDGDTIEPAASPRRSLTKVKAYHDGSTNSNGTC